MGSVFISYSHKDKKWLEELQPFLKPLERKFSIIPWADDRIKAGDDWKAGIDSAMAQADIALLLVTQAFLASDFIANNELPYLLEKHQRGELCLIPLFLKASNVKIAEERLVALQGYGSPDKPLAGLGEPERLKHYAALSARLLEIVTVHTPPGSAGVSPAEMAAKMAAFPGKGRGSDHLLEISTTTKPSKSIDLGREPRQEPREYALSIYLDNQGDQWVTQYRVPGNEPFLTTRRPCAPIWQSLQALLDMLAAGNRDTVKGIVDTANGYRNYGDPVNQSNNVGFRCARVQQ